MNTEIDDRFRQLVSELADTAPEPQPWGDVFDRRAGAVLGHGHNRRPLALVAVGAVVAAGAGVVAVTLLENDLGDGSRRAVVEASTTTTVTATGEPSVALGGGMARCAVRYDAADLDVLTDREVVFDGTVTAIGEPGEVGEHRFQHDVEVSFEVREWFVPDGPATVDVIMLAPGVISSNGTVDYGVGSRLLIVAGSRTDSEPLDSPVAGYCGFSRTYDEPTADAWREAFAASG